MINSLSKAFSQVNQLALMQWHMHRAQGMHLDQAGSIVLVSSARVGPTRPDLAHKWGLCAHRGETPTPSLI
jgi:hypothetical protein